MLCYLRYNGKVSKDLPFANSFLRFPKLFSLIFDPPVSLDSMECKMFICKSRLVQGMHQYVAKGCILKLLCLLCMMIYISGVHKVFLKSRLLMLNVIKCDTEILLIFPQKRKSQVEHTLHWHERLAVFLWTFLRMNSFMQSVTKEISFFLGNHNINCVYIIFFIFLDKNKQHLYGSINC